MEGDPALVVGLVDAGPVLHQEGHHVNVVIYTCLEEREQRRGGSENTERLVRLIICPRISIHANKHVNTSQQERAFQSVTDCRARPDPLLSLGSWGIPKMPAHSWGA